MKIYRPYITDNESSLIPQASGTLQVGTAEFAWGAGVFDDLQINNTPITPLSAANKAYVDAQISSEDFWQRAGTEVSLENAGDDIVPNASGTEGLGTAAKRWGSFYGDNAYINDLYLTGNSLHIGAFTVSDQNGALNVNGPIVASTPTQDIHLTTKAYVDAAVETANEFIELTDTPSTYAGAAASGVRVNAGGTGLEFYDITPFTEADTLQIVTDRGATTTNAITFAGGTTAGNINPDASGTIDLGTVALAFDEAHINKVYLEGDPTTTLEAATKGYVDTQVGSIVESDTLQIVTDRGAITTNSITTAGLTVTGGSIAPNASGSLDVGTVALSFGNVYADIVNLKADPTTELQAATKQYVDNSIVSADPGKVKVDISATADYIGAAANDGVLRVDSTLDYTDGGNYVTLGLDSTLKSNYDAAYSHINSDGSSHSYINQSVTTVATPQFAGLTTTGNIAVNASGTLDIGSAALRFGTAHIDTVKSDYVEVLTTPTAGNHAASKDYVDSVAQGLDWQDSVLDRYDPTGGLPADVDGNRYISTATANGWTINYIYEGTGGSGFTETVPNEGYAVWVEDEDVLYVYNGSTWVQFGSTIAHNLTTSKQGGTTDEYYHLTSAQHTVATQAASAVQNGYLTSTDWSTFNGKDAWGDAVDAVITPDASGTRNIGTVALAFNEAFIDVVNLSADPTSPLEAATKQYVDAQILGYDTFLELTDTPGSYAGAAASGVRVNATANGLEFYDATAPRSGHVHTQSVASTTWVVTHALNNANVIVQVTDGGTPENVIIPYNIELTDANTTTVTFPTAQSGVARIISLVLA